MLCEEIKNGRDSLYVVTANRYGSRTLTRDGNRSVFVTLDDATVCHYEGGTTAHIRGHSTFAYENLHGNLVRRTESSTSQNITQGFLYAPFGEITTEYNANFYNNVLPKYSFNAKELDEETGMYYYEARYYKPPVFTSRDPMFEKYFWMTPYAYCANNPVKYVDPDGEEMDDFAKDPTRYRNTKGELLFETQDGLDVDIIVTNGNIPALEKALQIAKDNGTLGDAETNKITMHVLGCTPQEYSEQATKGMDDYWSSGYRATYEKAYTEGASHLSFSEFFYSFAATIGEYSGENNLQKLYGGRSVGIEEGNSDRKAGRINRLNPQSSFKNNPPILVHDKNFIFM